jgi:uncharacterized protein YndB with AHSA1/START domain
MIRQPAAIRVSRRFSAPPERVFCAWLDPAVAGRWLFATALHPMTEVEIDARVGGSFRLAERRDGQVIEHAGEYVEIDPYRRLAFLLSETNRPRVVTCVTVDIAPVKAGCKVALTHENVSRGSASQIQGRWTGILYGLGVTLESIPRREGPNRRRADREGERSISGFAERLEASADLQH